MSHCSSLNEIPKFEHYAILTPDSVYIPGDERSRTHPGHGYPEYTQSFLTYQAFTDKAEWERAIAQLSNAAFGKKPFLAMKVTPAEVTTHVSVSVKVNI